MGKILKIKNQTFEKNINFSEKNSQPKTQVKIFENKPKPPQNKKKYSKITIIRNTIIRHPLNSYTEKSV